MATQSTSNSSNTLVEEGYTTGDPKIYITISGGRDCSPVDGLGRSLAKTKALGFQIFRVDLRCLDQFTNLENPTFVKIMKKEGHGYKKVTGNRYKTYLLALVDNDPEIVKKITQKKRIPGHLHEILTSIPDAYFPSIDALKNHIIESL